MRWTRSPGRWLAAALGLFLLVPAPAAAEGVHVGLMPASQTVAPGSDFAVELWVTEPGSLFNGYDAVIGYDPVALTFLPATPLSLQEGSYMTGVCGSTFHLFGAAGDSLAIAHALLCAGASLPGPGQLYKLKFRTSTTPQATWVRIRSVQFYNAGQYVNPVFPSDAQVQVGTTDVGPVAPVEMSLRASPNPSRGRVVLAVGAPTAGPQRLEALDLAGRRVRVIDQGAYAAGSRTAAWDGRGDSGRRVPDGVYFVVFSGGGRTARTRVAMIH